MAMSIQEMKDMRDENWKKAMKSHGELRKAYLDIWEGIQAEIESIEGDMEMDGEVLGEPRNSGMEDYLGIEDR